MKISIDSNEPLQDVIRVIGATYGVTLTVRPANAPMDETPTSSRPRGRSRRSSQANTASRTGSNGRGKSAKDLAAVSNAELRSWARENGHMVSDRGRVPAALVAAYRDAN